MSIVQTVVTSNNPDYQHKNDAVTFYFGATGQLTMLIPPSVSSGVITLSQLHIRVIDGTKVTRGEFQPVYEGTATFEIVRGGEKSLPENIELRSICGVSTILFKYPKYKNEQQLMFKINSTTQAQKTNDENILIYRMEVVLDRPKFGLQITRHHLIHLDRGGKKFYKRIEKNVFKYFEVLTGIEPLEQRLKQANTILQNYTTSSWSLDFLIQVYEIIRQSQPNPEIQKTVQKHKLPRMPSKKRSVMHDLKTLPTELKIYSAKLNKRLETLKDLEDENKPHLIELCKKHNIQKNSDDVKQILSYRLYNRYVDVDKRIRVPEVGNKRKRNNKSAQEKPSKKQRTLDNQNDSSGSFVFDESPKHDQVQHNNQGFYLSGGDAEEEEAEEEEEEAEEEGEEEGEEAEEEDGHMRKQAHNEVKEDDNTMQFGIQSIKRSVDQSEHDDLFERLIRSFGPDDFPTPESPIQENQKDTTKTSDDQNFKDFSEEFDFWILE